MRGLRSPLAISRSISGSVPVADVELVGDEVLGLGVAGGLDPGRDIRAGGGPSSPSAARSKPSISRPGSSQIDRLNGPSARVMPWSRSQSSAVAIRAAAASPSSASNMPHWPVPAPICSSTSSSTWALIRPTDLPAALRQPQLGLGMPEPGILLGVEQAVDLALERRHPGRIVRIDVPGEVDEGRAVRAWSRPGG